MAGEEIVVICGVCKGRYKGWDSKTQADGCACHYKDGFIYGHYGSKFDVSKYKLSQAAQDQIGKSFADPVCDECIQSWIVHGDATYVEEYLDFDEEGVRLI